MAGISCKFKAVTDYKLLIKFEKYMHGRSIGIKEENLVCHLKIMNSEINLAIIIDHIQTPKRVCAKAFNYENKMWYDCQWDNPQQKTKWFRN